MIQFFNVELIMLENVVAMFLFGGEITVKKVLIWLAVLGGMGILWTMFMPKIMGLQAKLAVRQAKGTLESIKDNYESAKLATLEKISGKGRSKKELQESGEVEEFLEFFAVEPVSADPTGVLDRLEHLLDVRKRRFEEEVDRLAPKASENEKADIEMCLQGALSTYMMYKTLRHLIKFTEKTGNMQIAQMIKMVLPMIEQFSESYKDATEAFAEEKAIGDSVGPMIATKIVGEDNEWEEKIGDTLYTEDKVADRNARVVKANGPGGRVGKPGELVRELVEEKKPDHIIMIDAGLKMEGEKTGKVVRGIGAAIGGPPTEKHKIEEVATEKEIPVDAFVVKEGLGEAINRMTEDIAKASDKAVENVKEFMQRYTDENDSLIIVGVGNTIGIGQNKAELPTEFVKSEKEEDEIESMVNLQGLMGGINDNREKISTV